MPLCGSTAKQRARAGSIIFKPTNKRGSIMSTCPKCDVFGYREGL